MGLELRGWDELGVVGTIYEEDDDDSLSSTIPSLDHTPSPQFSGVVKQRWCLETRQEEPDVLIHVQDSCFQLHKEALTSKSPYLKRRLSEMSEITLSPPLKITAETFSLVTDFCYGAYVAITPFNLAALRTASELLEMTEEGDNLGRKTEGYFLRVVVNNRDCALIVLESCLALLPEVETTSSLASRCIEALGSMGRDRGDLGWLDGIRKVRAEDLSLILESLSRRFTECHDLLYRIIDVYFEDNTRKVTEDQKIRLCNYIDCGSLSPKLLMHAVQNPKMPLRFIVQAMFVEQLSTRHSIISAADHRRRQPFVVDPKRHNHIASNEKDPITLGAILERDAALRQVSHLKTAMNTTYSRIQLLEKELSGMKKLLSESENNSRKIDSGRSASFRFSSEAVHKGNEVSRGQVGSVSSLSVREMKKKSGFREEDLSSEMSCDYDGIYDHKNGVVEKKFGRRLMSGLRSMFRLQKKKHENGKEATKSDNHRHKSDEKNEIVDNVVIVKKDQPFHRRSRSQSG